jgi:hypothetical protein
MYLFSLIWDIKIDWNLFNLKSENVLLRDDISFRNWVYYICICANVILRLVWIIGIVKMTLNEESWIFIVSFLDIFRQIMWIILKVESESYHSIEGHRKYLNVPSLQIEKNIKDLKHKTKN